MLSSDCRLGGIYHDSYEAKAHSAPSTLGPEYKTHGRTEHTAPWKASSGIDSHQPQGARELGRAESTQVLERLAFRAHVLRAQETAVTISSLGWAWLEKLHLWRRFQLDRSFKRMVRGGERDTKVLGCSPAPGTISGALHKLLVNCPKKKKKRKPPKEGYQPRLSETQNEFKLLSR